MQSNFTEKNLDAHNSHKMSNVFWTTYVPFGPVIHLKASKYRAKGRTTTELDVTKRAESFTVSALIFFDQFVFFSLFGPGKMG